MKMTTIAAAALTLFTAGAARAGDAKSEVNEQIKAWAAAFNAHDVGKLMAQYAEDPRYIYAFAGQEGAGKASLEAFYKQSFQMTPDITVKLVSYDVIPVNATTAVGMGVWEDTFTGPDGKKITAPTHSSELFVKVGGAWKVRVDHASFVPPPQPPPPAAVPAKPAK
ncbi:MAG TPA: nuclear transport factor 2 family protein [Myxococcales bacterium]|nr:nuclear transport factor 2 family protein [Myxococcales bacterium]